MNRLLIFLSFLLVAACTSVSKEKLSILNGYWEIERVEFPNGGQKEYKMNTTVDFIQVDGLKGYRKKMKPRFDGNYETSDDAESFEITIEKDIYTLNYKNNLSTWTEELTAISEDNFSVQNQDGIVYQYKRFEPIKINP
jgi:hypothetical protein